MSYQFKPWEIPTGGPRTPESVTIDVEPGELFAAKMAGIAAYHSSPREHWYLHKRGLADGSVVYLMPMGTGNLRLAVSPDAEAQYFTDQIYCYHDHDAAWRAVLGWNGKGDPEGWYRHPLTGRRRPDGMPETEYINASERMRRKA